MKPYTSLHSYIENIRNSFNFNVCNQGQCLRQWYKTMASGVTRICTLNLFSYHSSKILVTNCFCDGLNKIIWFLVRFLDLEKKKKTPKRTNLQMMVHLVIIFLKGKIYKRHQSKSWGQTLSNGRYTKDAKTTNKNYLKQTHKTLSH